MRSPAAPALAFDGSGYGVVWVERSGGGSCGVTHWSFARLDRNGEVIAGPVELTDALDALDGATLHFVDGAYSAMINTDTGDGPGVHLFRIDREGSLIGAPVRLTGPVVAYDTVPTGPEYAITTSTSLRDSDVRFLLAEPSGSTVASTELPLQGRIPRIVRTADMLAVASGASWESTEAMHLRPMGAPVGEPTRLCCDESPGGTIAGPPAVVASKPGSIVFYANPTRRTRPLMLARLGLRGELLRERAVTPPSWTLYPAAARSSLGDIGLIWKDRRTERHEVYFARFTEEGARLEADRVITSDHEWIGCDGQDGMSIVATDTGFAIATAEPRDRSGGRILFAHICRR